MSGRRILYLQYSNPSVYPSLQHSARLLASRGWTVFSLGLLAVGTEDVVPDPDSRITVRLWKASRGGWRLKLHYLLFAVAALFRTWRFRPQWLYVSDPEACPIAFFIRLFARVPMLYHEHDSPAPQAGHRGMTVVYRARRWISRSAALCVLPNAPRLAHFQTELSRHAGTFAVWNCPSTDEVGPARAPDDARSLTVLYQGSLVPERFPLTVLEAFALLPVEARLHVVGYETIGHPGYMALCRQRAAELNVGDRVNFLQGLPRAQLVALGRCCDVGLSFQPRVPGDINSAFMIGASNKLYEYLGNGLALLISETPGWREAFVDAGFGRACDPDDPASIADALRWFIEHAVERRAMGERGRRKALAEWNYEYQFRAVLEALERSAA